MNTIDGRRIRAIRTEVGLSLNELAETAHISKAALSALETNEDARPSANTLYALASALGCSMEYLMDLPELPRTQSAITGNDLAIENMQLKRRLNRIHRISEGGEE